MLLRPFRIKNVWKNPVGPRSMTPTLSEPVSILVPGQAAVLERAKSRRTRNKATTCSMSKTGTR